MDALFGWMQDALISWVLPSVAAAVGAYAVVLLKRLVEKVGLSLTADQEASVRRKVRDAIMQIEERKRREKMTPDVALKAAIAVAAQDLADKTPTELDALIHATLPAVRKELSMGPNPGLPGGGRR